MEQNRFFKWIWRINGLIIMGGGLLAICVLTYAAYKIAKNTFGERHVQNIVNIESNRDVSETPTFERMFQIGDSPYVMISRISSQQYGQDYYSKSTSSIRNWLFIDTSGTDQHWLLESDKQLITDFKLLSMKQDSSMDDKAIRAIMYTVISDDTNKDGRLTGEDAKNIAFSQADGTNYTVIVEGVDRFINYVRVSDLTLFVVYQKGTKAYSRKINLSDFSSTAASQLPEHE